MHSPLAALADIPRTIAFPAAAASLAYLNAKLGVAQDTWSISTAVRFGIQCQALEKADRINVFWAFERICTDPKSANRLFLVVPKDPATPQAQTQWTYAEAYETVLKYARWLKEAHGVVKNEIVAMDFTNRPAFIWMWFALWSLGAKPAFINTNLRSNAFVHCVKISTTRLLIVDPALREVLDSETKPALSTPSESGRAVETVILEQEAGILAGAPYRAPDEERAGEKLADTAILIYTSGTTGLPKAAKVNWTKPLSGYLFWPKMLGLKPTDRYFSAMPLYHSSASLLCICQALGPGCTLIIAPKFSPRNNMRVITETEATVSQYIGEMCRYLLSTPPSPYDRAHKLRLSFGNGMRPDVWQRYKDRFAIPDICEFYGATEAPGASVVYERNGFMRGAIGRSGTLGRLLFGANNVLLKHDTETDMPFRHPLTNFCSKVGTNEVGELVYPLDPANVTEKFQGYYGNDKATHGKILRDVFKKGDAYYRTGDLQRLDRDGRWWFVDRIGDTFRWKSENVSTAEVSEALGHHRAIREANVYGVALPNHDGRAGCAAIGLAEGVTLDAAVRRELAAEVRKRLPRYAVPLFLRVMRELEVTGTMKHQKVVLRNQGVEPAKVGEEELFWLPPGAEAYEAFGEREWQMLVSGQAKL